MSEVRKQQLWFQSFYMRSWKIQYISLMLNIFYAVSSLKPWTMFTLKVLLWAEYNLIITLTLYGSIVALPRKSAKQGQLVPIYKFCYIVGPGKNLQPPPTKSVIIRHPVQYRHTTIVPDSSTLQ